MSIHKTLGIRPLINASATLTKLGGSLMPPEVLAAMNDAATYWIELDEMQKRVGARVAELTRNESAYISSGASAGITIAAAALMTQKNPAYIAQLPDTRGMPRDEFIVHKSHRNGYDHAIRAAGGKVVEIGSAVHTHPWELESAIGPRTAGLFWFQGTMTNIGDLPFAQTIEICQKHDVPVIVDGSAQLPPMESLWKFTQAGATMAIFSGGKDLRGPQSSGICLGKHSLVEAMRMTGPPNHSVGRGFKVGKEEMAGVLAAVERYLKLDHVGRLRDCEQTVENWNRELCRIPGLNAERSWPNEAGQPLPRSRVTFDLPVKAEDVAKQLMDGDPAVVVATGRDNDIYLNPMTLDPGEAEIVLEQLQRVLLGK